MKTEAKKQNSKVSEVVVNVILVAAVIFAIFCSFTAYVTKSGSGVPSFLGYRPFAIQSDSMVPLFSAGDLIVDYKVEDPKELQIGDVITFWTIIEGQQVLNTHRIVEITDYENYLYFNTKGDANQIDDPVGVHQNDIVGKYLFHIPFLGTVIDFLQTGTGFFIVIVVPVFIFFVFQVVAFFKALFAYQGEKIRLQIEQERAKVLEEVKESAKAAKDDK